MSLTNEQKRFLAQELGEVAFSAQTATSVAGLSLKRIGDLAQLSESDLLRTPGFSIRSITEVKSLLATKNLKPGLVIADWNERVAVQWKDSSDEAAQQST